MDRCADQPKNAKILCFAEKFAILAVNLEAMAKNRSTRLDFRLNALSALGVRSGQIGEVFTGTQP
jgi:hypothetical protein